MNFVGTYISLIATYLKKLGDSNLMTSNRMKVKQIYLTPNQPIFNWEKHQFSSSNLLWVVRQMFVQPGNCFVAGFSAQFAENVRDVEGDGFRRNN